MELLTGPNLAALLALPGIGNKRALAIAEHFGTWDNFLGTDEGTLRDIVGAKTAKDLAANMPAPSQKSTAGSLTRVTSRFDPEFPPALLTIADPPLLLWWRGTLPTHQTLLAVVGTRTPNAFGTHVTRHVATRAAAHGIPTVSGLAAGVDSLGHQATLDAHLPTWAIVGQGLDTLPQNGERATLARKILESGGGIIAEVPPATPVAAHLLTARNRLQSGMSAGVFIAQTGLATGTKPAGTLHTARHALAQRRLLGVAAPPENLAADPALAGNQALINPEGMDPRTVHATDPELEHLIRSRAPVADFTIRSTHDVEKFCESVHAAGSRT